MVRSLDSGARRWSIAEYGRNADQTTGGTAAVKSAYELALERSGGALQELAPDLKKELAELERKYRAKLAEAELSGAARLQETGSADPEAATRIRDEISAALAAIRKDWERAQAKVRQRQHQKPQDQT